MRWVPRAAGAAPAGGQFSGAAAAYATAHFFAVFEAHIAGQLVQSCERAVSRSACGTAGHSAASPNPHARADWPTAQRRCGPRPRGAPHLLRRTPVAAGTARSSAGAWSPGSASRSALPQDPTPRHLRHLRPRRLRRRPRPVLPPRTASPAARTAAGLRRACRPSTSAGPGTPRSRPACTATATPWWCAAPPKERSARGWRTTHAVQNVFVRAQVLARGAGGRVLTPDLSRGLARGGTMGGCNGNHNDISIGGRKPGDSGASRPVQGGALAHSFSHWAACVAK